MGIEPTYEAWEAAVLPLNYTRSVRDSTCNGRARSWLGDTARMNASTILCLAALLALAGCERHASEEAPTQAAAASDNSAFLEGADSPASAASAASAPEPAATPAPHADRGPPPMVPDIVRDGVRYTQGDSDRDPGLPQATGMLVAYDDLSGKRLWTLAVYSEGADAKKAPDARWIFFRAMAFDPDGRLRVVNEAGEAFLVDVRRRTATLVPASEASAPRAASKR
jgi:hypothetical protein